ncbi:hypothetical protein B296_00005624 [Ensete ventricosum]|uniref:cysteine dioxygenase n=1 Tax=Ensete ventricosum TaxID=4639 RepID=A0A427AM63_ENSVE|nr:hypothetical protein B296_00005624 [Ensete ventricosum]
MRVGGKLAEQTAQEVSASKSASVKRRQSSKKSRREQKKLGPMPSAVQRLFETCKEVFANGGPGIVPSPEDVDRLRSILGVLFVYTFLIMTFNFSLSKSSFCLFHITSCRLILHLHTYILVIGLLVFAVLAVQPSGLRLAKVKTDGTFTAPCWTSVLFPQDGGNLHCFTAKTSCAVLDVLGPPYSNSEEGRDCTYYNDFPYASFRGTIINTCKCQTAQTFI